MRDVRVAAAGIQGPAGVPSSPERRHGSARSLQGGSNQGRTDMPLWTRRTDMPLWTREGLARVLSYRKFDTISTLLMLLVPHLGLSAERSLLSHSSGHWL